jgi:hypothetical protein
MSHGHFRTTYYHTVGMIKTTVTTNNNGSTKILQLSQVFWRTWRQKASMKTYSKNATYRLIERRHKYVRVDGLRKK